MSDHMIIFLLIVGFGFWVSYELHPHRRCRTCKGTGRQRGAILTYAHRQCTKCGGQTRHRRWGVQGLHRNSRTWAEWEAARARARRRAPRL